MSEFWWGVLALPIIAVAVAAAVGAVIGAWLIIDKWSEARWRKLPPIDLPDKHFYPWGGSGWLPGHSGLRGGYLSLLLTGMKGFTIRVTGSVGIIFVWGSDKSNQQRAKLLRRALDKAMVDVSKEAEDDITNT